MKFLRERRLPSVPMTTIRQNAGLYSNLNAGRVNCYFELQTQVSANPISQLLPLVGRYHRGIERLKQAHITQIFLNARVSL